MVIKRKTLLKMVLVLGLFVVGYWGVGERVKSTHNGKVLSSLESKDASASGDVAGLATDINKPAKSSVLTGDDKNNPKPNKTPNFVPAFSKNVDVNSSKEEPYKRKVYEGEALAGAGEKKEFLKLNFDSDLVGWEKKGDEGEVKVGGKLGQGILIDNSKYTLNKGQTFVASGTISFWLKFENVGESFGEIPILDWNFDDGSNSYQGSLFEISYVGVDRRLYFSIYDDDVEQDDISAVVPDPSSWHKIDISWDLTTKPFRRVIYMDGNNVAEGDFPIAPKSRELSDFTIGGSLGGRVGGKFIVDEIVMTNWAKSEQEIKQTQ